MQTFLGHPGFRELLIPVLMAPPTALFCRRTLYSLSLLPASRLPAFQRKDPSVFSLEFPRILHTLLLLYYMESFGLLFLPSSPPQPRYRLGLIWGVRESERERPLCSEHTTVFQGTSTVVELFKHHFPAINPSTCPQRCRSQTINIPKQLTVG